MIDAGWEGAFVATCVALGSDKDAAVAQLPEGGAARAARIVAALSAPSRAVRATALASALAAILMDAKATEARE